MTVMSTLELAITILGAVLVTAVLEIVRLRRRERALLTREAAAAARAQLKSEFEALEAAKLQQSFERGVLEGLKRAAEEQKLDTDAAYRMGHEKGLLEGEKNAEANFHIEHWTEIKKNQGYFFTSAEIVACYQLMYKNIPLGLPQKHVLEARESVDRAALDQMADRILGQTALGPTGPQGIRVIAREEKPKAIKG